LHGSLKAVTPHGQAMKQGSGANAAHRTKLQKFWY